MITVNFYGDLRRFGTRYHLHVASPAEALHALMTQIKGLREHIANGSYQVRFNRKDYSSEEVAQQFRDEGSGVLHIVPRVAGSGKVVRIVVGVILIIVGCLLSWTGIGVPIGNLGIALVLGGIAEMLTKPPKNGLNLSDVDMKNSTSFSNLANTQAQGVPVPLVYGRVMCGTRIISQGVETYRVEGVAGEGVVSGKTVADTAIARVYHEPVAATDPYGTPYNIDRNDDSVRAMNYTAHLVKG